MLGRSVIVSAAIAAVAMALGGGRAADQRTLQAAAAASDGTSVLVFGTIIGDARRRLAAEWDDSTAGQPERAYCVSHAELDVRVHPATGARTIAVLVDSVKTPDVVFADPKRIVYGCPSDQATIHVHTPTTCLTMPDGNTARATCVIGGAYAWFCGFSVMDSTTYTRTDRPFQIVQCDRNAFVFWWNPKLMKL